ncbi:D-alanyl-D-alanine carboxypeptidase family protein [Streptomyces sp. AC627_RSS907]|uniref:D-alanyl-D-alanine carboxypeptidase family protein n=1 Tax=Streptomyces sp. AC627_RSS907 TaxID=2823684 RepID=UPI001C242DA8|nr:serine hydrolase [Streptomyces sp. AC627_RSS907]
MAWRDHVPGLDGLRRTDRTDRTDRPDRTEPGATPREPAGRGGAVARNRVLQGVIVGAALLLVIASCGAFGDGADRHEAAGTRPAGEAPTALSLPWPKEGQSAVWAEGLGSLGAHGGHEPVPIASLTKMMTAYVLLQEHPLSATEPGPTVEIDATAADESGSGSETTAYVWQGQELSQRQLLELMLLPSANNIARFLARWDAGSQEAFVAKMNRAARELGMDDTTYTGASGVEATTTSTARDQLTLAREAMKDRAFRSIVAEPRATVPGSGTIANTNTLLGRDGVIGVKTGTTTAAGGNLVWATTVTVRGAERLVLGAVLHQRAGTSPPEAGPAARDASAALISALREKLPRALEARTAEAAGR